MMIRNIIFDLGGVMINLSFKRMQEELQKLGADPSAFFVKSSAKDASTISDGISASDLIKGYQTGDVETDEFLGMLQKCCAKLVSKDEIVNAWNSCLDGLPKERLEMVKSLRAKGYKTFILSNINDLHWEYIKQEYFKKQGYKVSHLFDAAFCSHEVHMAKPDPLIYRHVLKEIGSNGDDCLFIDDSSINVEIAMNEGIPSEWLDLTKENVIELINRINISAPSRNYGRRQYT